MTPDIRKLILFDIDGTLIDSRGAGIAALNLALKDLTGARDGFSSIDCSGKTDIQIMREACRNLDIQPLDGFLPRFMNRYLTHLESQVRIRKGGRIKVGIHNLLRRLQEGSNYRLGLLTGNIEKGARLKLEPHRLNDFFPFGAFGDDCEDRNQLLPIAVRRHFMHTGSSVDFSRCLIIGDTPRDVECAHVHGASCLAVATGRRHSLQDLERSGADLALADLSDTERVMKWIEKS
jgi:phosphoglycolate phosphatase